MGLDPSTVSSSIILAFATGIVVYGILRATQPAFVVKNKKFNRWKAIYYASVFSLVFTIIITFISLRVDEQFTKKNNPPLL